MILLSWLAVGGFSSGGVMTLLQPVTSKIKLLRKPVWCVSLVFAAAACSACWLVDVAVGLVY